MGSAHDPRLSALRQAGVRVVNSAALEALLALRQYVSIAHHVRGRIRLRISRSAVYSTDRLDRKQIEQALRTIPGINSVRVNPAAGSAVVEYATDRINPETWVLLLTGDSNAARIRLQSLLGSELDRVAAE